MAEDDKLRVHRASSTNKPKDSRSQVEARYSSLPQNLRDLDKNPVTKLSDDMKINAKQGGAAKLSSSYHPGMQSNIHRDSASATLVGEPFRSSQSSITDQAISHGGARPKTQRSNTVMGVSSQPYRGSDVSRKKNTDTSSTSPQEDYEPEKYGTPTQAADQVLPNYVDRETSNKGPKIHVKVLYPGNKIITQMLVDCDIEMYMKWQFILRSPTRLDNINKQLITLCDITQDSVLKIVSLYDEQGKLEETTKKIISAVVNDFGKGFKVEPLFVSETEAFPIAEQLMKLPIVNVLRILYAEAITDESIYLVYEKSKETVVKQQIEEKFQRFSVRVKLPLFWKKMSERIKLTEMLKKKHTVSVSFFECQDTGSYICNILSHFFQASETAGKVIFYRDSVRSKNIALTSYLKQAVKSLSLCEKLQSKIDMKVNSACLLVQTETDLQLCGFKEEYINTGMRIVQDELVEVVTDFTSHIGNQDEIQRKLDVELGKKVLIVTEGDRCVIVGLKKDVRAAKDILLDSFDDESVHVFSKKNSFEDEDLLDTLAMLAEDIAKLNNVVVDMEKTSRGHSVRFTGSNEDNVKKSIKDFTAAKSDVKKEVISVEKSKFNDKQVKARSLETEYKVKVLIDDITGLDKGQTDVHKERIMLEKDKTRCTWIFPTGRKLVVDMLEIGQCTEPEVIVVIAEKKSSISGVFSFLTDLGSKQKKVDMHLPKRTEVGRDVVQIVHNSLRKLLNKLSDQGHRTIGIVIESVKDWPFLRVAEALLTHILKYAGDFDRKDGLQQFTFCCDSLDKCKKVEALTRSSIGDPSFNEEEIQIDVVRGELNEFEADILVNTTSPTLDLNYGSVSAAILRTAGQELQTECKQKYPEGVRDRNVAVTGGYGLKCQFVIHGALHKYSARNQTQSIQELRDFLESCLHNADRLKAVSIAFPVIGSGNLGFPPALVASEMFSAVEKLKLGSEKSTLRFVYFVVYHQDSATLKVFQRVHADMVKHSIKASKVPSDVSDKKSTQPGFVTVKVIGKTNSVDEAVKSLNERYKQPFCGSVKYGLAESEMQQMIQNVLSHEYSIIAKNFSVEIEKMTDFGVELHYENDMIKFRGKIDKISESVKEVKEILQDLRSMYHIRLSVDDTDKRQIKSVLRQISKTFPEVYFYYDKIMAIIYVYGRKPDHVEDVKQVGKLFGHNKEDKQDTTEDKMSRAAKPTFQSNFSCTNNAKNLKIYQAGSLVVKVYEGDLLEAPVDCIVNAANKDLQHAGGIAYTIATRAGEELKKNCFYITQQAALTVGSVVETSAGNLPYKYVLHTVGPCWYEYQPITEKSLAKCEEDLFTAITNTFRKADELKIQSIALPAISSAIFRVPLEICALQYGMAVISFVRGTTCLKEICFVDKDRKTIDVIHSAFKCLITEDRPFLVNKKVFLDVKERQRSKSTRRNSQRKKGEIDKENSSSVGGMVLLEPICKMENSKMICVFTTCHEIHIYTGDILEQNGIDAIVCSEDKSFSAAGFVARELFKKGGEEYKKAKAEARRKLSIMDEGDVIISMGGRNRFPWVIHALIPNSKPIEHLKDLTEDILEECVREGFKSVVMSLLGSGQGKQQPELCSRQLLTAYKNFCIRNQGYKFTLHIVNIKKEITSAIQTTFKEYINNHSIAMQASSGCGNSNRTENLTSVKISVKENHFSNTMNNNQTASSTTEFSKSSVKSHLKNATDIDPTQMTTFHDTGGATARKHEKDSKSGQTSCADNVDKKEEVSYELPATCVICMDKLDNPKTLKCGHIFCTDCIDQYFKVKPVCPTCFTVCGVITGDQPDGVMEINKLITSVTGYENYGSFGVSYRFDSGHQGPQHPNPGAWFNGISRTGYLPNTEEGRKICAMLRVAFERRLVFTIGTSRTTGQEGVITWNDIHHKTDHRPNTQFGYPDATYLMRVQEELAVKGVMEEDIDKDFLKLLNDPNFRRRDFPVYSNSK